MLSGNSYASGVQIISVALFCIVCALCDQQSSGRCTLGNVFDGYWKYSVQRDEDVIPPAECPLYIDAYNCFGHTNASIQRRDILNWEWVSKQCQRHRNPLTVDWKSLSWVRNLSILYLGDSKTRATAAGFACRLFDETASYTSNSSTQFFSFHSSRFNTSIVFQYSPFLCKTRLTGHRWKEPHIMEDAKQVSPDIAAAFQLIQPDVVIVGTGAWWTTGKLTNVDHEDLFSTELSALATLHGFLAEAAPHATLLLRGEEIRHSGPSPIAEFGTCPFERPLFNVTAAQLLHHGNSRILERYTILKKFASQSRFRFIDNKALYRSRFDAHPDNLLSNGHDCLHYCYGSIPDIETYLTFEALDRPG